MRDLSRAKELLAGGALLALVKGESEIVREGRGIGPLLSLCLAGEGKGYAAADKIVGRAAAFCYAKMGVKAVYAQTLAVGAKEILARYGIAAEAGVLTQTIVNREGTGPCPMERAVEGIDSPEEAVPALEAALRRMTGNTFPKKTKKVGQEA